MLLVVVSPFVLMHTAVGMIVFVFLWYWWRVGRQIFFSSFQIIKKILRWVIIVEASLRNEKFDFQESKTFIHHYVRYLSSPWFLSFLTDVYWHSWEFINYKTRFLDTLFFGELYLIKSFQIFNVDKIIVIFFIMDSMYNYDYQFRLIVVGDSTVGKVGNI
jgi:hypothetical protein